MWDIVSRYWLTLLVGQFPDGPLGGLAATLLLSVAALVITFPFAVLLALARTVRSRLLFFPATAFVYLVRSVPLIMVLFWMYYALPFIVGFSTNEFITLVAALVIYQSAYLSEVVRGGLLAIPKGQFDAAASFGMSKFDIYWQIILPQVIRAVLPGIINVFVRIVKETSLGYVIGANELTFTIGLINSYELTKPLEIFALLALVYFVLCFCLTRIAGALVGVLSPGSTARIEKVHI